MYSLPLHYWPLYASLLHDIVHHSMYRRVCIIECSSQHGIHVHHRVHSVVCIITSLHHSIIFMYHFRAFIIIWTITISYIYCTYIHCSHCLVSFTWPCTLYYTNICTLCTLIYTYCTYQFTTSLFTLFNTIYIDICTHTYLVTEYCACIEDLYSNCKRT